MASTTQPGAPRPSLEARKHLEPYHRQLLGGPVIIVRNGFLDCAPAADDGSAVEALELHRTASAPAKLSELCLDCLENDEVAETDVDSHSVSSFGESQGSPAPSPELAPADLVRRGVEPTSGGGGHVLPMMVGPPGDAQMWPATPTNMGSPEAGNLQCGPPENGWLLPEAWAPPALKSQRVGRPQLDDGQGSDAGASWSSSQPPSAQASPAWSFSAAPALVLSPELLPQAAPAGPMSPQWAPQLAWHLAPQAAPSAAAPCPASGPSMVPAGPSEPPQPWEQFARASQDRTLEVLFGGGLPQAHTIAHAVSAATGVHRIVWTVDAGKLRNHERQAVSPSFELPLGFPVASRLVIFPKPNADGKGSASFRKSAGWGSVHLKCEAAGGTVSFMISVSDGTADHMRQPRGPVTHNFAEHSTCGLPKDQEQWDFGRVVNKASQTFAVCLDILPHSGV